MTAGMVREARRLQRRGTCERREAVDSDIHLRPLRMP